MDKGFREILVDRKYCPFCYKKIALRDRLFRKELKCGSCGRILKSRVIKYSK